MSAVCGRVSDNAARGIPPIRIGARGSALALAQAEQVAGLIGGEATEVVAISTSGDRGEAGGDKSRWVDGIERALLDGEIDIAVHSAKDLPGELASGLALLGSPARAEVEDAICGARSLGELPAGARVGTSSLRRAAQLRAVRADLEIVALAGNVDTRLAKLATRTDGLDAIVLAMAALQRLGRRGDAGSALDPQRFVPSPGQGALALEGRAEDPVARRAAAGITDRETLRGLRAERALASELQASCHTPLGAHATAVGDGELVLCGWVGLPDGSQWILDEQRGADPDELATLLAERMRAAGAGELLAAAEAAAT